MKLWLLLLIIMMLIICKTSTSSLEEQKNCPNRCGNVPIPSPFGIGNANCAKNQSFLLNCSNGQPFLLQHIPVLDISLAQGTVTVDLQTEWYEPTLTNKTLYGGFNLEGSPFTLSSTTQFVVLGCNVMAFIVEGEQIRSCCATFCNGDGMGPDDLASCSGVGCCKTYIPNHLKSFNLSVINLNISTTSRFLGLHMFLAERGTFDFSETKQFQNLSRKINSQVKLQWTVGENSCKEAQSDCGNNSVCVDSTNGHPRYRCICKPGFAGNPYISNGCQGNPHHPTPLLLFS